MKLKPLNILKVALYLIIVSYSITPSFAQEKPTPRSTNILWIYVDDMNDWFGCYGHPLAKTPNVDALAKQGVKFTRTYAPAPVCSATRSAVMTGSMQTSSGTHNHRTIVKHPLQKNFTTIPEIFRANGYLTFNNRKTDYNFTFDTNKLYSPKISKKVSTKNYDWLANLKDKPFFGQLQFWGGKVGGEAGGRFPAESRIADSAVTVPPQYPNTKVFKNGIARHLEQTMLLDAEVGKLVNALKEHDLYDNTIIMFFTDHGYQLPRAKQFLYEEGTRVPLIVTNLPEKSNITRNDLSNLIDLGPTSLEICKIPVPAYMEGKTLFALEYKPRDYIVTARDRLDYTFDRIRAIVTPNFKYIKNFHPERPITSPNYRDRYATFQELRKLHDSNKLSPLHEKIYFQPKPEEELYDLKNDPNEIHNLANDPKFKAELLKNRQRLADWIKSTGDQGAKPESKAELKAQLKRWKKKATAPEFDQVK